MRRQIFILLIIVILLSSYVSSLAIAPGHTDITFEPGAEHRIKLKITNQERQNMTIHFSAEGELAKYIIFDKSKIVLSADEAEKYVYYTLRLPTLFEKQGLHTANIVARVLPERVDNERVDISANIALAPTLNVMVPYTGKYAEIIIYSPNFQQGQSGNFAVEVRNLGTEDIEEAELVLDITNPTGQKIATLTSERFALASKQTKIVILDWTPEVGYGNYNLLANLSYDTENALAEAKFSIGELRVEITDINVKNFKLGQIAKFDIMLHNLWNEPLPGVFGEITITDNAGTTYTKFRTVPVDIGPDAEQPIQAYWDAADVGPGSYKMGVIINYLGKKFEKIFDIEVSLDKITTPFGGMAVTDDSEEANPLFTSISIVIMLLVIIIIILINIMFFLKKSKAKQGQNKTRLKKR